ncbi:MATE family efflux transporter [Treponema sp.]|uniref:MATE family efflux transporter n=1 Tax=Treponema sp. TaxID=166 RepID=UPI00298DED35|nr:MATE family efflux transporter [Treponema sp.]MCQ2241672.1 MATE family efflux transporter [Treponema sp.]
MDTESKQFYKSLFHVVGPIAVQNLITAAVSSADVIMLGYVGQTAIAASSLAGQIMFIMVMVATGLSSGLVMLAAQYWGKKDYESIMTLHGIALRISAIFGLIFSIAAAFFPQLLMKIFTADESLIQTGSQYLRAVSLSYVCFSISQVFQAGLKSIERVKIVTIMTTTALLLNICLNAVFIFGLFGCPKMGIVGVGIATTISRIIEMVFCIVYAARQKDVKFTLMNLFRFNKILNKDFIKFSLPALGNELVWGTGWAMYSVILGHMGEDIVAANSVVSVVRQLCTILCFGMAYGGAVVLGKTMGSGDLELAERNSKRLLKSTTFAGLGASLLILCFIPVLPYFAALTPTASHYRNVLVIINAFSIFGAAVNTCFICGLFRAGGDAKFGFIMDIISMWVVSVPLGLFVAFVLKLPPLGVYLILYLDEFEKMPAIIIHYLKKKWLKNITRDNLQ